MSPCPQNAGPECEEQGAAIMPALKDIRDHIVRQCRDIDPANAERYHRLPSNLPQVAAKDADHPRATSTDRKMMDEFMQNLAKPGKEITLQPCRDGPGRQQSNSPQSP